MQQVAPLSSHFRRAGFASIESSRCQSTEVPRSKSALDIVSAMLSTIG